MEQMRAMVIQRQSVQQLIKLLRKLHWIGMDEDAERLQRSLPKEQWRPIWLGHSDTD